MRVEAYLFFDGRAEEAIEFYKEALGAKVSVLMRFRDSPDPPSPEMVPPGSEDKIMHANLDFGEGQMMISDGRCSGRQSFSGFSLSLTAKDSAGAERLFNALAIGGKVDRPLGKTFWSPCFGMLTDRFGVGWMIGVLEG